MPLLRFRTGDTGTLSTHACPCGKTGLVIDTLSGRTSPTFRLPDQSEFYPTNLKCLFKLFPLREFQLTQLEANRIHAGVEFMPWCIDRRGQMVLIKAQIETLVGPLVTVTVAETQFLPDDKFQRFRTMMVH